MLITLLRFKYTVNKLNKTRQTSFMSLVMNKANKVSDLALSKLNWPNKWEPLLF